MTPHTECGDERSSEATASSHAQRLERKEKKSIANCRQKSTPNRREVEEHSFQPDADDKRSGTSGFLEQKQHLWRCG